MDNGNGGGYHVTDKSIISFIGLRLEMNRIKETEAISQLAFGLKVVLLGCRRYLGRKPLIYIEKDELTGHLSSTSDFAGAWVFTLGKWS